nr:hypothetical protein [uncultured Holophaga sp.]
MPPSSLHLLIIDPQNDFCDLPASHLPPDPVLGGTARMAPALPVPGAHGDMLRLAAFIQEAGPFITNLTLTLDCHQQLDIAHPGFWTLPDGSAVPPFTSVSAHQVRSGTFVPRWPDGLGRALSYLEALEQAGRYTHMVWPLHCQAGTWGQAVHADLQGACNTWEQRTGRNRAWVTKGMNPWTEHFSAVRAEVPDPADPSTLLNQALLGALRAADRVLIAGEAGSHCVKATTEHIVEHIGAEYLPSIALLEDCMSPVQGFEAHQMAFLDSMRSRGLRVLTSQTLLLELQSQR